MVTFLTNSFLFFFFVAAAGRLKTVKSPQRVTCLETFCASAKIGQSGSGGGGGI